MNRKSCPPGQANIKGHCVPVQRVFFTAIPVMANVPGAPSGGFAPFSNAAGPAAPSPTPAPAPAPGPSSFRFQYSGVIDSSTFETVSLAAPFNLIRLPLTVEMVYTLLPDSVSYRTIDGGFGGIGFSLSMPSRNFGLEFQGSNPSNFFVTTYTNYRPDPMNPGQLLADRRDYQIAVWPAGNPTIRITLDANLVPRLYFDGVEAIISPPGAPYDQPLAGGDYANVYGYNGMAGRSVDVHPLTIASGVIPPPGPV